MSARGSRPATYTDSLQGYPRWLPFVAVITLSAVLGLVVVTLGPVMALAGAAGVALAVLAFTHAELVIVVVFALASGLLPSQLNPFVSLPVGSLQVSDALLLLLLGVIVVRAAVEDKFEFRRTALDVPLLLFFGTVLTGLGVAVIGFGVNFADATYEVRMLAYYLVFFPITNLVRTRTQLARLVVGLLVVAVLLAILMLVTSAVGTVPGYMESWALQEEGVARVFHPGFTVVYVGLMMVMAYSALGGEKARSTETGWGQEVRWLLIGVLALGVLSTLARNVIVSGAVSFGLLFVVLRQRERLRLVEILAFIVLLSAMLVVGLIVSDEAGSLLRYADLYLERIGRMFSSDIIAEGENLQPRLVEMQYAWDKLQTHPILGIGLYNPYRPAFYRGEPPQLQHFLHNGYLALWIKTGLPGLLAFAWLSVLYIVRAFKNWARVSSSSPVGVSDSQVRLMRAAVLGSAVAFVGLLLSNLVAPTFVQPGSLAVFGMIFGINEAVLFSVRDHT